jgi:hypothetical protein
VVGRARGGPKAGARRGRCQGRWRASRRDGEGPRGSVCRGGESARRGRPLKAAHGQGSRHGQRGQARAPVVRRRAGGQPVPRRRDTLGRGQAVSSVCARLGMEQCIGKVRAARGPRHGEGERGAAGGAAARCRARAPQNVQTGPV